MKESIYFPIPLLIAVLLTCTALEVNAVHLKEGIDTSGHVLPEDTASREDAIRILLHEIIVPANLDHFVTCYLTKRPLKAGDRLRSFFAEDARVLSEPKWFAWIDDHPQAMFEHPTRFVLISVRSGKVEIWNENWWPVLNGESLFMDDASRKDLELVIYSDIHRKR